MTASGCYVCGGPCAGWTCRACGREEPGGPVCRACSWPEDSPAHRLQRAVGALCRVCGGAAVTLAPRRITALRRDRGLPDDAAELLHTALAAGLDLRLVSGAILDASGRTDLTSAVARAVLGPPLAELDGHPVMWRLPVVAEATR